MELRHQLERLGTERTKQQHAQFLANHAAQEKQMAAQGITLK